MTLQTITPCNGAGSWNLTFCDDTSVCAGVISFVASISAGQLSGHEETGRIPSELCEKYLRCASRLARASDLKRGEIIYRAGHRIGHVYFPETAVVAMIDTVEDGSTAEAGIIYHEGMVGIAPDQMCFCNGPRLTHIVCKSVSNPGKLMIANHGRQPSAI